MVLDITHLNKIQPKNLIIDLENLMTLMAWTFQNQLGICDD